MNSTHLFPFNKIVICPSVIDLSRSESLRSTNDYAKVLWILI